MGRSPLAFKGALRWELRYMVPCSFAWRLCPPFLILLFCGPILLRAQTNSASTRIVDVKPGGPAVTLEADVENGKDVFFVFQAKSGLKFSGHLATKSGTAGFAVDDPGGKGLPEEEFDFNTDLTGSLEKTGDYKISVATFDPHRVHFILIVRVY
jgi:hypothetical protein